MGTGCNRGLLNLGLFFRTPSVADPMRFHEVLCCLPAKKHWN